MEGEKVGMTVFYRTFSTWKGVTLYLEDFYVTPEYRQHGIGQQLFDAFVDTARQMGCRQTKWQVLDWNEPALRFYEKNGAVIEKEWWNGKIYF
jgi:GNAT superfamily N-acetyltransferase